MFINTFNHRRFIICLPWLLGSIAFSAFSKEDLAENVKGDSSDKPNFVWIVSEDNSIHYQNLFFDGGATTPHIAELAKKGLKFTHAFSNAAVCSSARSTLATGVYGPRIATHYHRGLKKTKLPKDWPLFQVLLNEAGYYSSNNYKKDYNFKAPQSIWHDSSKKASWRNRPDKSSPFFHMESHSASHESRMHFSEQSIDSKKLKHQANSVKLFPYFPDTAVFRYSHAYYLDKQLEIDRIVGETINKLKQDNLMDDTFIFYFGDHGGVLPRSKGYLYESGLHVPLVVYVPKNFRHLVDFELGKEVKGFVSFVDFAPTLLKLAGLDHPEYIDGKAFLGIGVNGKEVNNRDITFGYADRFDEKFDMVRSVRKGQYKYIRNYQGYYPDGLHNNYRYGQLAYKQWRKLNNEGKLNDIQSQFFQPRPAEQLFDIEADPHEVNNLADQPKYQQKMTQLRRYLNQQAKTMPDLSFYPESELIKKANSDLIGFAKNHQDDIAALVDIADLAVKPYKLVADELKQHLSSNNEWHRYWALINANMFGEQAKGLTEVITPLLQDKSVMVRIRAAEFLGQITQINPMPTLAKIIATEQSPGVVLAALNTVTYLTSRGLELNSELQVSAVARKNSLVRQRIKYLKSSIVSHKNN
ncbi:sulfatase-like hydrolase/transferase [Thalassotalea sp. ND16A]|uniref:sulfatase-like hydrolase/transferase n=1 Tax=Thalassotalea sp. ND16A TaxID=1535422 RepID=UPI00051A73DC|nr:sulfatase-like hydrolase/transferase [Thalassotalea sp. ND16A]KGK00086.1 hypothetical protein ND16A_0277 [Thalassotalea sp. ND16A]